MSVRKIEKLLIEHITIGERLRPIDQKAMEAIKDSMARIGLRTPITVRVNPKDEYPEPILVSGHHRLCAATALGWDHIECFISEDADEDRARMWEIAENLHRSDLSDVERSSHIVEWMRLASKPGQLAHVSGGRGKQGGVSHAARELGIERTEARRAEKIDAIGDDAKAVAAELGFDSNQTVLLAAAQADDKVAFLRAEHDRREAERRRKEIERANKNENRVIEITEAEKFANWLLERADLSELTVVIAWLEGIRPREVIDALRRRAA